MNITRRNALKIVSTTAAELFSRAKCFARLFSSRLTSAIPTPRWKPLIRPSQVIYSSTLEQVAP